MLCMVLRHSPITPTVTFFNLRMRCSYPSRKDAACIFPLILILNTKAAGICLLSFPKTTDVKAQKEASG